MSRPSRDLDLEEDLGFQNKEWRAQRIGTVLLFVFVIAAVLGLTGRGGPLSRGEAGRRDDRVFVEFDRFVRRGAPATVRLHLRTTPGEVRFWISAPYFDHVRIVSVAPPAGDVVIEPDRHIYTVQSQSAGATITLEVEHHTIGTIDVEVGLVGGPSVGFRQFAYF